MINFKKILTITPALICFSTITFAANLSGSDISICKSYLDAIANNTTLSTAQKSQANSTLENCLSNNPNGCSNFPNSPNCANIKAKIDSTGQAISMPNPVPSISPPLAAKPIQVNATSTITPPPASPPPITPNNGTSQSYSTPPSNSSKSTTQPTNQKNDRSEPYSYF